MKLRNSILTNYLFGIILPMFFLLGGCTVVKVVDTAASTAVGAAVGAAKVTGKVVGATMPDGDEDE